MLVDTVHIVLCKLIPAAQKQSMCLQVLRIFVLLPFSTVAKNNNNTILNLPDLSAVLKSRGHFWFGLVMTISSSYLPFLSCSSPLIVGA